jgi:hypothetical protein
MEPIDDALPDRARACYTEEDEVGVADRPRQPAAPLQENERV